MLFAGFLLASAVFAATPLERFDAEVDATYPGTPSVSAVAVLSGAMDSAAVLVDAREAEERSVSMLPGAITVETLRQSVPADVPVVIVYCTIGMRSAALTQRLRAQGWTAYNLRGGVLAWAAAGGTFVRPDGEATREVHVYGPRWNHLPRGFEAVW